MRRRGPSLNERLGFVYAPKLLEPLSMDLKAMHRIDNLAFGVPDEKIVGSFEKLDETYFKA